MHTQSARARTFPRRGFRFGMVIIRVSFLCVVVVVVRVLDDVALGLGRRSAAWRVGALCLDLDHLVVVVAHFGLGLIARVLALGLASAPRACSSLGPLLGTSRQYGGCSHETMRIITSSSFSRFSLNFRTVSEKFLGSNAWNAVRPPPPPPPPLSVMNE